MTTAEREFLPQLDVRAPLRQRRWTVLLRDLLLIPHVIVQVVVGVVASVVLLVSWFAALVLGRLPNWSARFLGSYLGYYTRVYAYWYLLVDVYPPFRWHAPDYPVTITLAPGRLNRLAVFFRMLLAVPAVVVMDVVGSGWAALSFFLWLIVLVLGRTPGPVFGATAAVVRYGLRLQAYLMMLSSAYPKRLFGEDGPLAAEGSLAAQDPFAAGGHFAAAAPFGAAVPFGAGGTTGSDTRPLVLSGGARRLLIAFIVLGVLAVIGGTAGNASHPAVDPHTVSGR
jgi:hypothetical protein